MIRVSWTRSWKLGALSNPRQRNLRRDARGRAILQRWMMPIGECPRPYPMTFRSVRRQTWNFTRRF